MGLMSQGGGGSGSSGSSSGFDYEARIDALETVAARIPTTFNNNEWTQLLIVVGSIPKPGIDLMKTLTWEMVFNAVKKVPHTFQENTLQAIKDVVAAIPNTFNTSTWTDVTNAAKKIPSVFTVDTLQQLYDDVDDFKNNQGVPDEDTGSSNDYETRIQALEKVASKIPGTLNLVTWNDVRMKTNILPLLPVLPIETLTWVDVVTTIKKIPTFFNTSTLQTMFDDITAITDKVSILPILPLPPNETLTWGDVINAVKMIPELQQTVTNMISQLNVQSLINLETLQAALDNADGSLETIATRLQQMQ
jgi:hypothetical protein